MGKSEKKNKWLVYELIEGQPCMRVVEDGIDLINQSRTFLGENFKIATIGKRRKNGYKYNN